MSKKMYTGVDLVNQKAINVGDPTNSLDAVNLQYLLNFVRGLVNKDACRAASVAQTSLTAPGASMDGVALLANDRVLLKNQTNNAENGIYIWSASNAALVRATDADTGNDLRPGTTTFVVEGSINGDKSFSIISDTPITVGSTAMQWGVTGGSTVAYAAGLGVLLSSGVISADLAIMTRKYSQTIGDASASTFIVTHGLNTKDIVTSLRLTATDEVAEADVFATSLTTATFIFAAPPATGGVRVTILG